MEIKGEAAIVTGGGSGIGADVARHLARAGAKVAVLDLNREAAEAVAKAQPGSSSMSRASSFPAESSARRARCRWRSSAR